jgi:hypothetical protein
MDFVLKRNVEGIDFSVFELSSGNLSFKEDIKLVMVSAMSMTYGMVTHLRKGSASRLWESEVMVY